MAFSVASFTLFRNSMRLVPPVPLFSPPPCWLLEGFTIYVFTISRWNFLSETRPCTHLLYAFRTPSLPLDLTNSRTEGPDSKERRKLRWAGGMYSLISWRNSAADPTVRWRQVRWLGRSECKASRLHDHYLKPLWRIWRTPTPHDLLHAPISPEDRISKCS